jgi:hypothetical protein
MRDHTAQPEFAGPQSESGFSGEPGPFSNPRRPDPAAEMIERTRRAEQAYDLGRGIPEDVLDLR